VLSDYAMGKNLSCTFITSYLYQVVFGLFSVPYTMTHSDFVSNWHLGICSHHVPFVIEEGLRLI